MLKSSSYFHIFVLRQTSRRSDHVDEPSLQGSPYSMEKWFDIQALMILTAAYLLNSF